MENPITVSIIVPVYNAAAHLKGCVDSILAQTLSTFELILVDDGSTDGSGALCDKLAEDPRVKVIHQKNSGPGAARNCGIEAASGTYIGFVDADDSIDRDFYKTLYDTAVRTGSDLIFCDYTEQAKTGNSTVKSDLSGDRSYAKKEIDSLILPYFFGYANDEVARYKEFCPFADYSSYVWLGLYRTAMLKDHQLRFPDQRRYYNEDHLFNLGAVFSAQKITHIAKALYFYNLCDDSLTKRYNPGFLPAKLNRYTYLADFIKDNSLDTAFLNRLDNKICVESINIINYYTGASIPLTEKYDKIRQTIEAPAVVQALKRLDLQQLPPSKLSLFLRLEKSHAYRTLLFLSLAYGLVRRLHRG